ncbi:MAG: hypothetical protein HY691_20455 [Chloroflexi bacterium]|nr:hypothetical protein [Chloroflexota bacterium]
MLPKGVTLILSLLLVRWVVGRMFRLALWIGLVLAVALAGSALVARADDGLEVVLVEPLAPAMPPCPLADGPRGLFFAQTQTVVLPDPAPPGIRYMLAANSNGTGQPRTDDQAVLLITAADGRVRRVVLSFRRADDGEVLPLEPVDLTALLAPGEIALRLELYDLVKPTCSSTPYFLVGRAPRLPESAEPRAGGSGPTQEAGPAHASLPSAVQPGPSDWLLWLAGGLALFAATAMLLRRILRAVVAGAVARAGGLR